MVEKVNNSRGTIPFNIFSGSAVGLTSKVGRSPSIDTSPRKKSDEIDHPPEDNVCESDHYKLGDQERHVSSDQLGPWLLVLYMG